MTNDLARYLSRVAIDDAFRELAMRDPDASFAGYDLDDDARDTLRRQDADMLGLLAKALHEPDPVAPTPRPRADVSVPTAGQVIPEVALYLRVVPMVSGDGGADATIAHAASLHPAPPADTQPGVTFAVRITPLATPAGDGQLQLDYTATIEPLAAGATLPAGDPDNPWGHRLESPEAIAAAEVVRAAAPEDRYARLLDLIAVLVED